jgi:hypothetical protein
MIKLSETAKDGKYQRDFRIKKNRLIVSYDYPFIINGALIVINDGYGVKSFCKSGR